MRCVEGVRLTDEELELIQREYQYSLIELRRAADVWAEEYKTHMTGSDLHNCCQMATKFALLPENWVR